MYFLKASDNHRHIALIFCSDIPFVKTVVAALILKLCPLYCLLLNHTNFKTNIADLRNNSVTLVSHSWNEKRTRTWFPDLKVCPKGLDWTNCVIFFVTFYIQSLWLAFTMLERFHSQLKSYWTVWFDLAKHTDCTDNNDHFCLLKL